MESQLTHAWLDVWRRTRWSGWKLWDSLNRLVIKSFDFLVVVLLEEQVFIRSNGFDDPDDPDEIFMEVPCNQKNLYSIPREWSEQRTHRSCISYAESCSRRCSLPKTQEVEPTKRMPSVSVFRRVIHIDYHGSSRGDALRMVPQMLSMKRHTKKQNIWWRRSSLQPEQEPLNNGSSKTFLWADFRRASIRIDLQMHFLSYILNI